MAAKNETPKPAIPPELTPEQRELLEATEASAHERLWSEPIGVGESAPFDPNLHEPTLSDEDIQRLLEERAGR